MILNEATTKRVYEEVPGDSQYWLEPGDLLIQRANSLAYLGAAAIYEGEPKRYIYPDLMMRVRTGDQSLRQYLWRFLNTHECRSYFKSNATGTAGNMPKINGKIVKATPVPLPPTNEQRRIVAKIEELTARSRNAKQALDAIPPLLERFRQSVLAAAFRGDLTKQWRQQNPNTEPASELLNRIRQDRRHRWEQDYLQTQKAKGKQPKNDKWKAKYKEPEPVDTTDLPELPEVWCWAAAEELCFKTITAGNTPSRNLMSSHGEVPFIKVYNLTKDGSLDFTKDPTFVSQTTHREKLTRSILYPGDVLMNIVGPPLGKVSLVPDTFPEWNMNQAIVVFRPMEFYSKEVLCYALLTERIHSWAKGQSKATAGQFNVRTTACRRIPIPIMSEAEQSVIAEALQNHLARIDLIESAVLSNCALQERLDQSILAKAFRGELILQDPTDEPASALLERVRTESQS